MQLELAARAAGACAKDTLDVQVLHGLDNFLATEQFLGKLEQARAEWIDLSEHAHHAAAGPSYPGIHSNGGAFASAAAANAHSVAQQPAAVAVAAQPGAGQAPQQVPSGPGECGLDPAAAALAAAAIGDFVVIDKNDAVEAMAYYIALYISRMPEAQRMQPKELQMALRETFAILRRSKWRMVWSWGRLIYRSAAVSFSALQLYNNPWLLRAVLSALWASSRLLYAQLV